MPNVVVLKTLDERVAGVIPFQPLKPNDVYFFPNVAARQEVTGMGLTEPIVVYFLDEHFEPFMQAYILKPGLGVSAPGGTAHIVETSSHGPEIVRFGFLRRHL